MASRSNRGALLGSFVLGTIWGFIMAVGLAFALGMRSNAGAEYAAEIDRILAGVVGMDGLEAVKTVCARMVVEACKRVHADPNPEAHSVEEDGQNGTCRIWYDSGQLVLRLDAKRTVLATSFDSR